MEEISTSRRAPFGANPTVGEAGRATQQRILAAANDAFAANGYTRTSVEAITDLAGCSRPTFYQYFSGKEDLHRRLAARFGAELLTLLDALGPITADRRGRDEIAQWLVGLGVVHGRYRAVADTFAAAVRTDDRMVTGSASLSTAYRARLCEVIVDAPPHPIPLDVQATAINSIAYGASAQRSQVVSISQARMIDALADLLHRSIFGGIAGVNMAPARPGARRRAATPIRRDTYDGGTHRSRGTATRTRLVDAAGVAFGTLGYDRVRVDDIATEAGVSHGTFYRYYADKDAVFAEHVEAATDACEAALASWPLAPGAETRWAQDYFALFARMGGIITCLPEAQTARLECAARSRRAVSRVMATGLDARGFGDTDADIVACFALLESFPASAYRGLGVSVDDALGAAALVLARGVFGGSA